MMVFQLKRLQKFTDSERYFPIIFNLKNLFIYFFIISKLKKLVAILAVIVVFAAAAVSKYYLTIH